MERYAPSRFSVVVLDSFMLVFVRTYWLDSGTAHEMGSAYNGVILRYPHWLRLRVQATVLPSLFSGDLQYVS